jgi:hypothetical protein
VPGQPLRNPDWNPKVQTSPYLNRAAFEQPPNRVFGNLSATIAQLRQPVQMNEDLAASKFWGLGKEGRTLEFRASAFNLANRHLLGGLSTGLTGQTFGQFSTPQSNQARNLQFGLRVSF